MPNTLAGRAFLTLFFLIFFSAGVAFTWMMGRQLLQALATRSWQPVDCTIIGESITQKAPYLAKVNYRYPLCGQMFNSNVVQVGYTGSADYYQAQRILDAYQVGSHAMCRVNPASVWTLLGLLFPMVFVVIGAGGIYFVWRSPSRAIKPISVNKAKAIPVVVLGVFFTVGLVLIGFLVPMLIRYRSAQHWTAVPCDILHSSVKTTSGDADSGDTYSVDVLFRYRFNNKRYESSRYTLVSYSSSGYAEKKIVSDSLDQNRRQTCYVNPFDPAEAVLDRGSSAIYIILGIAAAITLSIGGGGIGVMLRQTRNALLIAPPQARLPASQRGSKELQPATAPVLLLIGRCVPALFWNAIVSVFVVTIINQWQHGDREIAEALFISVFVIIGIGLVARAICDSRRLFLPSVQLILSRYPMEIGEPVELRWQFPNGVDRLKQLKIRVAIFDVSADPAGTLPLRNLTPSWSMDLIDTTRRADIHSGRRTFAIPMEGLPPVFKWKRIWAILVQGEMDKGPSLRREFSMQVQTAGRDSRSRGIYA
jgi:hypothetical protein